MLPLSPAFSGVSGVIRHGAALVPSQETRHHITEKSGRVPPADSPNTCHRVGVRPCRFYWASDARRRSSISITWRPRYCPHDGHTWCGIFIERQLLHGTRFGAAMKWWRRRLPCRARLIRCLGSAPIFHILLGTVCRANPKRPLRRLFSITVSPTRRNLLFIARERCAHSSSSSCSNSANRAST